MALEPPQVPRGDLSNSETVDVVRGFRVDSLRVEVAEVLPIHNCILLLVIDVG